MCVNGLDICANELNENGSSPIFRVDPKFLKQNAVMFESLKLFDDDYATTIDIVSAWS